MKPFLREVLEDIIFNKKPNFKNTLFVLPNKRTGIFIKKYFSEIVGSPDWFPKIVTLDELMQEYSEYSFGNKLFLIFDLFQSFQKLTNKSESTIAPDFESFYPLGEIILRDFDELDSNLIDINNVFSNVLHLKEIDQLFNHYTDEQVEIIQSFWQNFSVEALSEEKKRFIEFWELMPRLYSSFVDEIRKKDYAYRGFVYSELIKSLDTGRLNISNTGSIFLIGFHILNKCQKKIISYLCKTCDTYIYWDFDSYYLKNEIQEAGFFLRENLQLFGNDGADSVTTDNFGQHKNIYSVSYPGVSGLVKSLPVLFSKLNIDNNERCAIVLADENALYPVLYNLPHQVEDINISMGYPIKNTQVFSLLKYYILNTVNGSKNKEQQYYYKDVMNLLQHPLVLTLDKENIEHLLQTIAEKNIVSVPQVLLLEKNLALLNLLFEKTLSVQHFMENIKKIVWYLIENFTELDHLTQESFNVALESINTFRSLTEQIQENLEIKIVTKLFLQYLSGVSIPFKGEPLKGIQITGLLETRNIDFEHVFIVGMNEDILPKLDTPSSLIPENLRYAHKLSTLKHQDSLYSYLFYRVLQRAKNIVLLSDNTESGKVAEQSRYILQLKLESPHNIIHLQPGAMMSLAKSNDIIIEKNDDILNILEKFEHGKQGESYFSPSSINTYLDCTLKFYFKHIVKIAVDEKVDEEISPPMFGNLFHVAMELLYRDVMKKTKNGAIQKKHMQACKNNVSIYVSKALDEFYGLPGNTGGHSGEQLIVSEILKKYVLRIIEIDERNVPFTLLDVENDKDYMSHLEFKNEDKTIKVKIKGIFDRIDKINDTIRIIDYKTGKAEKTFKTIDELFLRDLKKRKKAAFQTFLYIWLYKEIHKTEQQVTSGIYNLSDIFHEDFNPYIYQKDTQLTNLEIDNLMPGFLSQLKDIFSEIYSSDVPFTQTADNQICATCDYRIICNR